MVATRRSALATVRSITCCTALLATALLAASLLAEPARAQKPLQLHDGADGVTCEFFNRAGSLRWRQPRGDWIDRAGSAMGTEPFASQAVPNFNRIRVIEWDVTAAAMLALRQRGGRVALMLVETNPAADGIAHFQSREAPDPDKRPALVLRTSAGRELALAPHADSTLNCTTNQSAGAAAGLVVGDKRTAIVEFDLPPMNGRESLQHAALRLSTHPLQYRNATVGVFLADTPMRLEPGRPAAGLAAKYPGDNGIERDPDVYMATGFEEANWRSKWSAIESKADVVSETTEPGFRALAGKALRAFAPRGSNNGLSIRYLFKDKSGQEPEQAYFRYYLWLAADFGSGTQMGKLPGFAGTYRAGGWGDRPAGGTTGWAMRGLFGFAPMAGNPLHQKLAIGTYAATPEPGTEMGASWWWSRNLGGLVPRERWNAIEHFVQLNTPGASDGVHRAWVNGELVFERTNVRLRDVDRLRIEEVWMNVYYGGQAPAPHDQRAYIDNVVIAKRYIGPMAEHPR